MGVELSPREVNMYLTVIKYLAPVVIVGLLWWRYDYVTTQNVKLKADLSAANELVKQSADLIAKERQNAAEVALRAQKFYEDKQHDQTELDSLRKCVADKSCGVRVVKGACPIVSGANSNTGGTEAADAADRKQFEQDYFNLLASVKETERLYNWMQKELIARSAPDYCKAK